MYNSSNDVASVIFLFALVKAVGATVVVKCAHSSRVFHSNNYIIIIGNLYL